VPFENSLVFNGNSYIELNQPLFKEIQNTFTIEFWAKPEGNQYVDKQSRKGISLLNNKKFVMVPIFGAYEDQDHNRAGVGISVGSNGVSVYEHTTNHCPATLVYSGQVHDWTHIAVVYVNKRPSLYVNGQFVKKGRKSLKKVVVPSAVFGGMDEYGYYNGGIKELRIWSKERTLFDIQEDINKELLGSEEGLSCYLKLNEGSGIIAYDSSRNKNHGTIMRASWEGNQTIKNKNNSRNVLFTFFIPSGGVETLNRQRFHALGEFGWNCHFLYSQPGTGLQNKMSTSVFVTNSDEEIRNIVSKYNYEAIIVGSDLVLLQKLRQFGYKGILIYEIQGLGFNKEYADQFLKNHYSIIQNHCDAILYPQTPHLIQSFNKHFPSKRKFCFDNCFNSKDFKYQSHPKKENPIVGWVGRIEENKNWKDFLLIGAELIKENPKIQLWMFEDNTLGEKAERMAFEQKLQELNLKNNLEIIPNQPHAKMAEYFSIIGDSGGFLCSTSKVEGFGYAVLEAMVCKCPVLSTDSDGVRSFIKHNITGKFFTLGNIPEAVKEAKELMYNTQMREKIRLEGIKHIELKFSPEKYANNFFNMIENLRTIK
jgi:glycosyltransferase involved in cell wall biosynthesis